MSKSGSRKYQASAMVNTVPILVPVLAVAVPLFLYALFLGLVSIPYVQRHVLYAHKFHTLWWGDINKPEQWGFAKNQVTPFHITTADNETLYAWHILPLPLYAQYESTLADQPTGLSPDITATQNFRLLRNDPKAKLVITFHGNAAQLTQGYRPAHYHSLTGPHAPYHVLAIDYRGFGLSTGSPTERGLILDAAAVIDWAVHTAGVPPSRIVLVGHSLGTAVVAGVGEELMLGRGQHQDDLYRRLHQQQQQQQQQQQENGELEQGEGRNGDGGGWDFAGIVLVAPFSSLPRMLSGYAIAGFVPVLRPLACWPALLQFVMGRVVDKWDSAARWRAVVRGVAARGGRLRLSFVHAKDDWDIPSHEDDKLFRAAVEGLVEGGGGEVEVEWFEEGKDRRTVVRGKDSFVATWAEGDVVVRQELVPYGGHNPILTSAPVLLAAMRCFCVDDTAES